MKSITSTEDYGRMSVKELLNIISGQHHPAMLEAFDSTITHLNTAHKVEPREEEVSFILSTVEKLKRSFEDHASKEDHLLFPIIINAKKGQDASMSFKELSDFIADLEREHKIMGEELQKIKRVTLDYKCSVTASPSHKLAYAQLNDLEQDFKRLVFVEEIYLFPRIQKLNK